MSPLNYLVEGDAGAPALVFSNSLGTDLSMWDAQASALRDRFRIVRYDTRGHGRSAVVEGATTIATLGRDVVDLLDRLGIERASFCGLSLGGMTGMWLAVHAPARIERLVLANTSARIAPPELWNERIAKVAKDGMSAVSQTVIGRWFTAAFAAREPAVVAGVKAMLERQPPAGYAACCAAIRDMDQRDAVSAIAAPTLVITGSDDLATPPADGAFLAQRIAGAKLVELPAAHLSNIEARDRFTGEIANFLEGAP